MAELIRRLSFTKEHPAESLVDREWLVTNGIGGFASGSVAGVPTRRYHGLLIAALPTPLGRTVMLNHLSEWARTPGAFERCGVAAPGPQPRAVRSVTSSSSDQGAATEGTRA